VTHQDGKDADQQKERDGAGSDPPSPSPFERFEEFARKVILVPKATIDERERTYRKGRKPKPVHSS